MSVPIPNDEKTSADKFYRYKRDSLDITEGKTQYTWKNFGKIMKQLKADKDKFIKKLQKAMNQKVTEKNDQLTFKSLSIDINDFLEAYIRKYVLCGVCGLPELEDGCCRACGGAD